MSATLSRRRIRRRRLIAAVVAIDLIGVAALAFAFTRPAHRTATATVSAAAVSIPVAHPQAPQTLIGDPASATSTPPAPSHPRHRKPHPASPSGGGDVSGANAQASFAQLAASLPGASGIAVGSLSGGPIATYGGLQVGHAWSTMKAPVLTTLLSQLAQGGGTLSSAQRADATAALEASDNSAAEALFSALESSDGGLIGASSAVQDTLHHAGDDATQINTAPNSSGFTTWGQSEWSATGEVAFYRALADGCLLSGSDTSYVLSLMGQVQSDQRWGAGSAGYPSAVTVAFKGGWGPENGSGYLVRQTAIIRTGSGGYVMSMLAKPSDGSFSSGAQMLTQIASWAARTLPIGGSGRSGGCR